MMGTCVIRIQLSSYIATLYPWPINYCNATELVGFGALIVVDRNTSVVILSFLTTDAACMPLMNFQLDMYNNYYSLGIK